jgi:hypothetical protein
MYERAACGHLSESSMLRLEFGGRCFDLGELSDDLFRVILELAQLSRACDEGISRACVSVRVCARVRACACVQLRVRAHTYTHTEQASKTHQHDG